MTRKKVKLVWIANDAARKASLKKRRSGLMKKVSELTILCDVNAFVIIYSQGEAEPMTWPARPEVVEMLARYQSIPEMERSKKKMNQETYLKDRICKSHDTLTKDSKKNRHVEMSYIMHKLHLRAGDINCLELAERHGLVWLLEERMRDLRKRYTYFQQAPPLIAPDSLLPPWQEQQVLPPPPAPRPPLHPPPNFDERVPGGVGEFRANPTDSMIWDQWFLDMVENSDHVAGGSGSSTANPPPPQGFNFGCGGGDYMGGALGIGLHSGGGNPFELGMAPPNPNPFGIGFCQGDFGGFASDMNPLGHGSTPPPRPAEVGGFNQGNEEGFSGFFPSGSDAAGLPWPPNISP